MSDLVDSREKMEIESVDGVSSTTNYEMADASKQIMDTSEASKNVMAPGTTGSVTCSLHPLVIMNVSEHWTRVRAQAERQVPQVFGALIGKQKGRNIEIMNSFELVVNTIGEDIVIDRDYYNMKEEQFKQVFSDMDFIGWYTTGDAPNNSDIKVHKQICEINESPIVMKLNPHDKNIDHLPVALYESVIDLVSGEATMLFVPLSYTLAAEEAERIGVDHVARMSSTDSGESSLVAEHLTAQHSAIKMLHSRVRLVLEYMKAIQSGQLPRNHEILREAYSLCHRLPVVQSARFRQDFYNQCNDVGLMTYLGALTKSCNDLNQFVNKFNILYERQGLVGKISGKQNKQFGLVCTNYFYPPLNRMFMDTKLTYRYTEGIAFEILIREMEDPLIVKYAGSEIQFLCHFLKF